jgi:large subunit ribosomal protein L17
MLKSPKAEKKTRRSRKSSAAKAEVPAAEEVKTEAPAAEAAAEEAKAE